MKIEREEFDDWLQHPVTEAMMRRAMDIQEGLRLSWLKSSWNTALDDLQKIPTEKLAYLRGKAEAFKSLSELKYTDLFKDEQTNEEKSSKAAS